MIPKDEIMAGFPTSHLTQIAGSINVWIVDWPAISKHPSMDGQIVRAEVSRDIEGPQSYLSLVEWKANKGDDGKNVLQIPPRR